jgi:hypothetical protein
MAEGGGRSVEAADWGGRGAKAAWHRARVTVAAGGGWRGNRGRQAVGGGGICGDDCGGWPGKENRRKKKWRWATAHYYIYYLDVTRS